MIWYSNLVSLLRVYCIQIIVSVKGKGLMYYSHLVSLLRVYCIQIIVSVKGKGLKVKSEHMCKM